MTYSAFLGFSWSYIGAAVAEAILEDIRKNSLSLDGFPQILVSRLDAESFSIELRFGKNSTDFILSNEEAKQAVELMRIKKHDQAIFDLVQKSLAELEGLDRRC